MSSSEKRKKKLKLKSHQYKISANLFSSCSEAHIYSLYFLFGFLRQAKTAKGDRRDVLVALECFFFFFFCNHLRLKWPSE